MLCYIINPNYFEDRKKRMHLFINIFKIIYLFPIVNDLNNKIR